MEYNKPIKKEEEKKNWLSYISEKSEEVYKIFKATTILMSIGYIIYKYNCLKNVEKFYGIPYFYFLNMDIMHDIIYYILIITMLVYGIISILISIGIEKNEGSLENSEGMLLILNFPNIFTMLFFISILFTYKINIFHPLLIFIYVIMSIISFFAYFTSYIIEETLYFLKNIKQISKENKEKFKLISNEIVKKLNGFVKIF
ncbi:hypothetical protein [Sneathia sanguinegens]|uniref:hypothetical protein n=1 Tax=Sneathia sanguinegens TaxID=40543 RepID=UPI002908CFD0|nr:hypothetical protein [Sneathia sanguinegens]MDU7496836.1 hypothetical protein [Sneathia sanguinegens]